MNLYLFNCDLMSEDFGGCVFGFMVCGVRWEGYFWVDGKGWIDIGYCLNQFGLLFIICLWDFIWIVLFIFDFQIRGVYVVWGY